MVSDLQQGFLHLSRVVEETPYPALIISIDNRILMCNQALADFLGLSREEIEGHYCFEVIHGLKSLPNFCPLKGEICTSSLCDQNSKCFQFTNRKEIKSDGGILIKEFYEPRWHRYFRVTIFPLYNSQGVHWGYLHFIEDQTEKVRLFEEAVAALVVTSPDGKILRANRRAKELFKVPKEVSLEGLSSLRFWRDLRTRDSFMKKLLVEKEIYNFETVLLDYTGSEFYALLSSKLYEEPAGVIIYTAIQDVTSYLRLKEEAVKFVKEVLEFLPLGVAVIDDTDRVLYINPKFCEITGYEKEELIGSPLHQKLVADETLRKKAYYAFREISAGRGSYLSRKRVEALARRKDGSTFPVEVIFGEFNLNNQRFFVGAVQDITERKLLEERLIREEKEFVIEKIAGGLAHDLNNLLMIIKGYLELLYERMTQYSEKDRIYVEKILFSFDRMKHLVAELFILSRGEIQTTELVKVSEAITQWVPFFLQGTGIEVKFELDETLTLPIKESHFMCLIQNIVLNAKESMDGVGVLKVRTYGTPSDIVIEIRDSGKGIPPHLTDKIFEPGFSTKPHGSGLGLFVVKRIMDIYGGKVEIQSEPGSGTTVTLRFPRPQLRENLLSERVPQEKREPLSENINILILEDEEEIRNVLEEFLRERGFSVHSAENGDLALSAFLRALEEGRPFTHLLLDLTVPQGKGGVYFLSKLREHGIDLSRYKIIIMTGFTEREIQEQTRDYKIDGILFKPFSLERIVEVL